LVSETSYPRSLIFPSISYDAIVAEGSNLVIDYLALKPLHSLLYSYVDAFLELKKGEQIRLQKLQEREKRRASILLKSIQSDNNNNRPIESEKRVLIVKPEESADAEEVYLTSPFSLLSLKTKIAQTFHLNVDLIREIYKPKDSLRVLIKEDQHVENLQPNTLLIFTFTS